MSTNTPKPQKEIVICIHGLWMPGFALSLLSYRLKRCGFEVMLFSYSSTHRDVTTNAANLTRFIETCNANLIPLVGHSLGGLVIRQMLHDTPELSSRIGRIVTMGTPHNGSEVARRLRQSRC